MNLDGLKKLYVKQTFEPFEFIGFETRNKYSILNESSQVIGYAAEQQKSLLQNIFRQLLKHWRTFEIFVFDNSKKKILHITHPFRFYFQRLEVKNETGKLVGVVQKRFGIISKNYDINDARGKTLFKIRAGIFKIWTYQVTNNNRQVATIKKHMGKILTEIFTDKDTFHIDFNDPAITNDEKLLLLATTLMIDLQHFENNKANLLDFGLD